MASKSGDQLGPLNICVVAACPFPANHGSPGSIRELSEALSRRGHQVHIVTYPFGEEIDVQGVHIHRVGDLFGERQVVVGPTWRKPFYDALLVLKIIEVCWKHNIDIVHAHLYEAALAAWLARFATWKPFVYSGHNTMADELASYDFFRSKRLANGIARFLDWFVPRRANRCIPHSEHMLTFFADQGMSERCEPVVNFGIDFEDLEARKRQEHALKKQDALRPTLVYTGVLDQFQRLDLLLEAVAILRTTHPSMLLTICMTLEQQPFADQLNHKANELGIQENLQITDRLDFDGCLAAIDQADIAVCPRPQTPGFPIKLLNYWAMGKPVVMFDSSASGIEHKRHAWLAEDDSAESLATGIDELLSDSELRQCLGDNGRAYVLEHHDRHKIAGQIEACFAKMLRPTNRWRTICLRHKERQEDELRLVGAGIRS